MFFRFTGADQGGTATIDKQVTPNSFDIAARSSANASWTATAFDDD